MAPASESVSRFIQGYRPWLTIATVNEFIRASREGDREREREREGIKNLKRDKFMQKTCA